MAANGWGDGAWGDVGWGGFGDSIFTPSPATASSSLGSESISGSAPVDATGVSGAISLGTVQSFQSALVTAPSFYNQVHLGSVTVRIPIDVSVTGVSGTIESLTGWGDGTWGELVWGGGVFADVGQVLPVSLNQISSSVGAVSMTGDALVSPTGVAGNTLLESVLIGAGAIVTEDAITGTIGIGDEAVVGTANVFPTGISGTMQLGDEFIETDTGAPVTGVPALTSALGDESVVIDVAPTITGLSSTGAVGSPTNTGTAVVSLTGTPLTPSIGTALVWGEIRPDPGTSWSGIAA